jgi:hypothetical protein
MKYRCVNAFYIELVDGDGFSTGEYDTVEKGSIWVKNEEDYRFIGGEVRLEKEDDECDWLEISESSLREDFEEVTE